MRPWDGKVVEPAVTDPPEPPADFPDIVVPALAEHLADARQGPADPFGDRFATQPEASSPGRRAIVREAQKVECLRLAHPALAPVQQREPAKLHEAGLVRVQAQTEPGQPLPNVAQVSLRIPLVLEPDNDIVSVANDDRFVNGYVRPRLFGEQDLVRMGGPASAVAVSPQEIFSKTGVEATPRG